MMISCTRHTFPVQWYVILITYITANIKPQPFNLGNSSYISSSQKNMKKPPEFTPLRPSSHPGNHQRSFVSGTSVVLADLLEALLGPKHETIQTFFTLKGHLPATVAPELWAPKKNWGIEIYVYIYCVHLLACIIHKFIHVGKVTIYMYIYIYLYEYTCTNFVQYIIYIY